MEENKKKPETEEEMKERLKAEIMEELLEELKSEKKEEKENSSEKEPKETVKKEHLEPLPKPKVKFDDYNDNGIKAVNEMNRKDRKFDSKEPVDSTKFHLPKSEEETTSKTTLVIMGIGLVLVVVAIFGFPSLYRLIEGRERASHYTNPNTNTNTNDTPTLETITLDSDIVKNRLTYPVMRNSEYQKQTYYTHEEITMSDFSNNDILYNALIHVRPGNFAEYKGAYNGSYCGDASQKKTVNAKYLDARIKNLFTRDTEYEHATFTVPSTNTSTTYVGKWVYDAKNNRYIYYGDCTGVTRGNKLYYDLISAYEASGSNNNTTVEVLYHVAFAEVDATSKRYTIYRDANFTETLTSGTLTTNNYQSELDGIFTTFLANNKEGVNTYKYTFSSSNCSYQDYCFAKGEWVK